MNDDDGRSVEMKSLKSKRSGRKKSKRRKSQVHDDFDDDVASIAASRK